MYAFYRTRTVPPHGAQPEQPSLEVEAPSVLGRRLFWQLQGVTWLFFGVIYYLAVVPRSNDPALTLLLLKLAWATAGLVISSLLAGFYSTVRLIQRSLVFTVGVVVALSMVIAVLWVLGMGGIATLMAGSSAMLYTPASFPFVALNHLFVLLAWSGAYLALTFWQRSQQAERASLAAEGLARQAQLEMLQYQLHPHFLFNVLTSIRALIRNNPEQAWEMVTRLSEFLRYALSHWNGPQVTLARELQIVQDYLMMEQVRFEERLQVQVTVDPALTSLQVPPFLLHPLVENAVKHGTPSDDDVLSIAICAWCEHDATILEIANTGRLQPAAQNHRTPIGLRNVRERLAVSFPARHRFKVYQDGEWVRARIELTRDHHGEAN